MGSVATTQKEKYRAPFMPVMPGVEFVAFNDVAALRAKFSDEFCAICLEAVQGEGGIRPVSQEFLDAARELTRSTGALLIIDEIQAGLGRTGKWCAYQHYGVQPDITTLAKPLAGGLPLGAMLCTEEVRARDGAWPARHDIRRRTAGVRRRHCGDRHAEARRHARAHSGCRRLLPRAACAAGGTALLVVAGARGLGLMLALGASLCRCCEIRCRCHDGAPHPDQPHQRNRVCGFFRPTFLASRMWTLLSPHWTTFLPGTRPPKIALSYEDTPRHPHGGTQIGR